LTAGCGDGDGTGPSDEPTLTIELTDAPGDLAHAWVEIRKISLTGGDESGGPVLLDEPTELIDLLTLAGTTAELIRDVPIEPGTYGQLRIVIGDAIVEAEDGRVFATEGAGHPEGMAATGDLKCPSCTQSGLKVNFRGGLQLKSEAKVVVLDFDVSQSFGRERGNSGRWVMSPVITATEVGVSATVTGSVSLAEGAAMPECGGEARSLTDFVPTIADGETVKTGLVSDDGSFSIAYIPPGAYSVSYEDAIEFDAEALRLTATVSAEDVVLGSGESASVDYIISEATCGPTTE